MKATRFIPLVASAILLPLLWAPGAVAQQNCPVQEEDVMVCREGTELGLWVRLPEGTWVFVYAYALSFVGLEHCTGYQIYVDTLNVHSNYHCATLTDDPGVRWHLGVLGVWFNARASGSEVCYAIAQGSWNCLTIVSPSEAS